MTENPQPSPQHRHEKRDLNARYVGLFFAGLFILLVLSLLAMWGMFGFFAEEQAESQPPPPPLAASRPKEPPAPRLQVNPPVDLKEIRQGEEEQLNSYGWVQKEAGVVHIPIARAKTLLLERGLPVREQPRQISEKP
jgi:hypothetical protein